MSQMYFNDQLYYSVPEAADRIGVSRMTMLRWIHRAEPYGSISGIQVKVLRDAVTGHYYIAEQTVKKLANRFQPV